MPRNVHIGSVRKRKNKKTVSEVSRSDVNGAESSANQSNVITVFKRKKYTKFLKKFSDRFKDTKVFDIGAFFKRKFHEFVVFCVGDRDITFREFSVRHVRPGYYLRNVFVYSIKVFWLFVRGVFRILFPIVTPLCGIAIIAVSWWALSTHSVALRVTLSGETLGYVSSESDFNEISNKVAEDVLAKTGENYVMDELPSMELSIVNNEDITEEDEIYSVLSSMADDYMGKTYGFFLDGVLVATSRDESDFTKLREDLVAYYLTGAEGETWELLNDFEIVRDSYDRKYLSTYSDLWSMFTKPVESVKHTVVLEDEWETLSEDYDIPVAILKLMNPDVSTLTVGDEIEVGKPAYQLSVQTTRSIYYTESIPYTTVYIDNDSIYEGNTAVKTAGSSGSYSVTAEVVTVNGVETERVVTDRVQTVAPVNREIYVGTRTISPSGSFIFPVSSSGYHYKSSNFGWRTLYGSSNYHRGVDLAARYGTAIYAADAGTVISYGWDPYGALGYQIKIDHGNGIVSVYGHCSRLSSNVYLGKRVYQGEVIAYVGSTGNSTGNHLHFGLYYSSSGTYFDPWPYIS